MVCPELVQQETIRVLTSTIIIPAQGQVLATWLIEPALESLLHPGAYNDILKQMGCS